MKGRAQMNNYILKLLKENGRVQEEWRRTVIMQIYKGNGDLVICENGRGISLVNHKVKVYERMTEKKTEGKG